MEALKESIFQFNSDILDLVNTLQLVQKLSLLKQLFQLLQTSNLFEQKILI